MLDVAFLSTAAPLLVEWPLERARASPWKSYGRTGIMVLVDGDDGDWGDDALAFHFVHGDDEETHQDALV